MYSDAVGMMGHKKYTFRILTKISGEMVCTNQWSNLVLTVYDKRKRCATYVMYYVHYYGTL